MTGYLPEILLALGLIAVIAVIVLVFIGIQSGNILDAMSGGPPGPFSDTTP